MGIYADDRIFGIQIYNFNEDDGGIVYGDYGENDGLNYGGEDDFGINGYDN
jgi:hypothetical protein